MIPVMMEGLEQKYDTELSRGITVFFAYRKIPKFLDTHYFYCKHSKIHTTGHSITAVSIDTGLVYKQRMINNDLIYTCI